MFDASLRKTQMTDFPLFLPTPPITWLSSVFTLQRCLSEP
jgi:hypothetical protein